MSGSEDVRLLIEIAHMYYDEELTQQQIARKMSMSRSLVSKLLNKARKEGIVEITIKDRDLYPYRVMENHIKHVFGLSDVILADVLKSHHPRKKLASEAAGFLARKISGAKYVAVSAGRMTREIAVSFSSPVPFSETTFVPMSGGLGEERWEIQANNVCKYFAHNCGAKRLQLHAPVVVDSPMAREILMRQHFIGDVLEKARQADIAIVGIGNSQQYFDLSASYLQKSGQDDKEFKGVIKGDISYNYYDECGEIVDCNWNRQLMGISMEELQEIPEVICVVTELEKAESVYIALKEGLITALVTDVRVVKKVLEYRAKEGKEKEDESEKIKK